MMGRHACLVMVLGGGCTRPNPNYCPAGVGQCADAGEDSDSGSGANGSDAPASDAATACVPQLMYQNGNAIFAGGQVRLVDLMTFEDHAVSNGVDVDQLAEWSPDGQRVAVVRNAMSLWTVRYDGSDAHEVISSTEFFLQYPTWSPDGARLLYQTVSSGTDPGRLYSAAASGSGSPVYLTVTTQGEGPLQWAHGGSKILFVSNRTGNLDVFLMDANGGNASKRDQPGARRYGSSVVSRRHGHRARVPRTHLALRTGRLEPQKPHRDGNEQRRTTAVVIGQQSDLFS